MTSVKVPLIGKPLDLTERTSKMPLLKSKVPPRLKSIMSLPVDFRFMTGSSLGNLGRPEVNEELQAKSDAQEDESPYIGNTVSFDTEGNSEEPGNDLLSNHVDNPSLLPVLQSNGDSRWNDTSSYAKKVCQSFSFQASFFFNYIK